MHHWKRAGVVFTASCLSCVEDSSESFGLSGENLIADWRRMGLCATSFLLLKIMNPIIRSILLYLSTVVCFLIAVLFTGEIVGHNLGQALNILGIHKIALTSTMLALMFPGAFRQANKDEDSENEPFAIFMFSCIYVLPLSLIFPDEKALKILYLDKARIMWGFMFLWWAHGFINGWHVHMNNKKSKQMNDEMK